MKSIRLLILSASLLLLLCACGAGTDIPCLNDPAAVWENLSQITLYSDGYYGRSMDEPLVITDAAAIEDLTDALRNPRAYRAVSTEKSLEGLNGLWIDFGNGVVLGLYADENYGSFSDAVEPDGSPCYRLPSSLCRRIRSLLAENAG